MAPLIVTDATFQSEVLDEKEKVVIVDFWAEWCGPCKMLAPVIDAVSESRSADIKVCKLDVDSNPEIAQKSSITSIPCNIVYKNGEEVGRIIGHRSQDAFEAEIDQILG